MKLSSNLSDVSSALCTQPHIRGKEIALFLSLVSIWRSIIQQQTDHNAYTWILQTHTT